LFSFTLTAPTPLYPLSLHDALPISPDSHPISPRVHTHDLPQQACRPLAGTLGGPSSPRKESRCTGQESWVALAHFYRPFYPDLLDRKSTRLNSSHVAISYAVFCLKK